MAEAGDKELLRALMTYDVDNVADIGEGAEQDLAGLVLGVLARPTARRVRQQLLTVAAHPIQIQAEKQNIDMVEIVGRTANQKWMQWCIDYDQISNPTYLN